MLNKKIIYENEKGKSIEIAYSFPFFFDEIQGISGVVTNIFKTKSYGQDGSTITNKSLQDRPIVITGIIKGVTADEMVTNRNTLITVFNPKLNGKLIYKEGNMKRAIDCVVEEGPKFSKGSLWKYQNFMINLLAPNPFWTDLQELKEEIALWRSDFEFPMEILETGIEMGHREPSLIVNVNNGGDVVAGMRIEFKALGTVKNPSLFNVNTREYIKINKTMVQGERIVISTTFGKKRVESILNGIITNAFNYIDLDSTFLQLDPGDNLLRYDAEENLDNLEVSIYYTPRYLGV